MIRRFRLSDLHQILHIEAQAFPKSSYAPEIFIHYHKTSPDSFLVLAEAIVFGYIIFMSDGHIISIAVDPAYRMTGIGTKLMNACENQCRSGRLFVEVRESNVGAQRFYEKLGFRLEYRIRFYYGKEDAHVMEKQIVEGT